jgi:hypothetical protein
MAVLVGSTSLWAAGGDLPGSGTEADPYLIEDLADFDEFADSVNAATYWASGVHTRLACDPNMAGRTYTTATLSGNTRPNRAFLGCNATWRAGFVGKLLKLRWIFGIIGLTELA